jgi:amidase
MCNASEIGSAVRAPVDTVGAFVGEPRLMARGAPVGALAGKSLAVKDVIDVEGVVTGAGNPTFARDHAAASESACSVVQLVAAGATVVGKTITDELAYALSGTNVHYGTPRNVAAPGRIPGGSSAGSAAAVAAGLCDLALGTDTAGSIRVPASYCGIIGWRPTHGAVSDTGIVHLAPSFDVVGLLTKDARLLVRAAEVLLAGHPEGEPVSALTPLTAAVDLDAAACATAFSLIQGYEAWAEHGSWITKANPDFAPDIAARFAAASRVTLDEIKPALHLRETVRRLILEATEGGRVLVGPATSGAAPRRDAEPGIVATARAATLRLTAVASMAGAPVVVLPLDSDDSLPLGVAHLGAPGSDLPLLRWAAQRMAN